MGRVGRAALGECMTGAAFASDAARGKSGVAWAEIGGAVSHWESMWQEWWLVLAVLSIIFIVLLGLLWLVIEFPGITGWKVVHKESPEGQARQAKWRRDSLVIEQRERRGRAVKHFQQRSFYISHYFYNFIK